MLGNALLSFSLGVLLLGGPKIVIGVEADPAIIDIPQIPILGYLMLVVCVISLLPSWIVAKASKFVKRAIKRLSQNQALKSMTKKLL